MESKEGFMQISDVGRRARILGCKLERMQHMKLS